MPKKRKRDEEDSDYEDDGESPDSVEEEEYDDEDDDIIEDDPDEDFAPKAKKSSLKKKKPSAAMKKEWRELVSSKPENSNTSDRLTEHGGYAHTLDSKMKISKANKGNTPWNKGKQRSAADRAKIGAGVRARNRAILLEKLKNIGMSEEEWHEKKKQLKYLRERVRRAKKAKNDNELAEHQKSLQDALDEQDKVNNQSSQLEIDMASAKKKPKKKSAKASANALEEEPTALHVPKEELGSPPTNRKAPIKANKKPNAGANAKKKKDPPLPPKTKRNDVMPPKAKTVEKSFVNFKSKLQNGKKVRKRSMPAPQSITGPGGVRLADIFARDVNFKDHDFDSSDLENPYETCPNGGPGGLICCATCTTNYSSFLSATAKDIEKQKTRKVNKETKELLGFLTGAKAKLDDALRLAKQRTKSGPLHRAQRQPNNSVRHQDNREQPTGLADDGPLQLNWNLQQNGERVTSGPGALAVVDGQDPQQQNLPTVFQSLVDSTRLELNLLDGGGSKSFGEDEGEEHKSIDFVEV